MTSVFQLYGRPLAENASLPPLRIEGYLAGYVSGEDYSSRLQIVDNVGKCTVELIDGSLPDGYRLFVDNFTSEVVLEWDAYTSPETPRTDVPNGGFEDGDDGSWVKGPGWSIINPGAGFETDTGTWSAEFANTRGVSSLTGARVRVQPDTPITASCRIQQGASSEGNCVAQMLLVWYDATGARLSSDTWAYGNLVRDGSGGEWKTSSVSASAPNAASFVGFDIAANRKRQNRALRVDSCVWNHEWFTGTEADEEFFITLRVRDSANRTAIWSGVLSENYIYFTSRPYDSVGAPDLLTFALSVLDLDIRTPPAITMEPEAVGFAVTVLSAELRDQVQSYTAQPEAVIPSVATVSLALTSILKKYDDGAPEAVQPQVSAVNIALTTVVITYGNARPEAVQPTISTQGITLT